MFKSYIFSLKALIVIFAILLPGANLFAQSNIVYLNSSASQVWKVKQQSDVTNATDIDRENYSTAKLSFNNLFGIIVLL